MSIKNGNGKKLADTFRALKLVSASVTTIKPFRQAPKLKC